jgi:hypothetical protein
MITQLWDMAMVAEFLGWDFLSAWADLNMILTNCQLLIETKTTDNSEAVKSLRDHGRMAIEIIADRCRGNQLNISGDVAVAIARSLEPDAQGDSHWGAEMMEASIWAIRRAILSEMRTIRFARIPRNKGAWFGQNELFGGRVHLVFPLARDDIREAGNCLALGLDTAAVFHLMRAAEHGARHVARSLGLGKLKGKKPTPVEHATWDKIARQIAAKIEVEHKKSPSTARANRLNHWSEMSAHVLAFKDAWRDDIMHSRKTYNEFEATNILVHVRGFMQRVAEGAR